MKILCSACLLGENCKYNGENNFCKAVVEYVKGHEVISLCPEVLGGLSTPRKPAEIVSGRVVNADGIFVDTEFRHGAEIALEIALLNKVEVAILQSRSPSCGSKQIYDGSFSGKLKEGRGVFAELLKENGIRIIDAYDIEKLNSK